MAKGPLNGLMKGKLGNSVFYKIANSKDKEKQGVRQYIPQVANPRSDGQIYQRAVIATVMRAYAAGKAIFDHSFEGVKSGGMSMNHFRKINVDKLRAAIIADVTGSVAVADQNGRVVAPGINTPVPFELIVSEGSLEQDLFTYDSGFKLPAATSAETVAAYAARNNLVAGDIFTLVMFMVNPSNPVAAAANAGNSNYGKQFDCRFGFVRLTVKANLNSNTDAVSTLGQLFTVERNNPQINVTADTTIATALSINGVGSPKYTCGSLAMIKSRDNERLRSNTTMIMEGKANFGIASEYLLNAWQLGVARIGQSPLILEGGNF